MRSTRLGLILLATAFGPSALAEDALGSASQRFGLFNSLDRRSIYGSSWFPEPLRAPETDVDRELRLDYFHGEKRNRQVDDLKAELEYNFGLLTIEVEVPYERKSESSFEGGRIIHDRSEGIPALELSARYPIYQYVSPDHFLDYTLVGALEVAIPVNRDLARDTEIVPQIFQAIRIGEHFSIQTTAGLSMLIGPDEGGHNAFEYNVVLGYNIEHEQLPIPGVMRTVPIFELNGDLGLNRGDSGHNSLFGTAGVRFNLKSIGPGQPRLGVGYVFPLDRGAREEMDWAIVTSWVFEF